jgi:hypothetical protein
VSSGPGNLADLAESLLAALVAAYATDGVDPPERQYTTVGTPVGECSALVVAWEQLADASALEEKARPASLAARNGALLTAWAFRCLSAIPDGEGAQLLEAPSVAELTADARVAMTDAYVMRRGALRAALAGTIGGPGLGVQVGSAVPAEPQGGVGGVQLPILVDVF